MPFDNPVLPPHDHELECAVLGGILIGGSVDAVGEFVSAEDFYLSSHQSIFTAIQAVSKRGDGIDYLSVSEELKALQKLDAIGGSSYLAELLSSVSSHVNTVTHAKGVRELSLLRNFQRLSFDIASSVESHARAEDIATDVEKRLYAALWQRQTTSWIKGADLMQEVMDHIDAIRMRNATLTGITTGLIDLDAMLGGWHESDLIIIAARTSHGKTAFMCHAALRAAREGHKVAICTLEMGRQQIGSRLLAIEAHMNLQVLHHPGMSLDAYAAMTHASVEIAKLPLMIDESTGITMEQLRAKVRQLKIKQQIDVLFVDYLQLIASKRSRDSRQVEIAEISRGLKLLAKELSMPVIALSQVSRECEKREDKRPILSDLRESGAIEQDADVVIFLYRDEVYNRQSELAGIAELLVRKHRNGPTGDIQIAFRKESASFANLSDREQ